MDVDVDPAGGYAGTDGGGGPPNSIWVCENPNEDGSEPNIGSAGAGGAAPIEEFSAPASLPPGGEATRAELIGTWTRGSPFEGIYWYGYDDAFYFEADGSGWQETSVWTDTSTGGSTRYVGTIELHEHVITLDSTSGTSNYCSSSTSQPLLSTCKYENLPHQIVHYGYSYDAATDTLYVNTARCSPPLAFKRFHE